MTTKKPEILDLDKIVPELRIVKLAGKEIDVSKIPSEVTLSIAEKTDMLKSGSSESFPVIFDMIIKICNATNPDDDITKEWLIRNTSMEQLLALMDFVMKPLRERADVNGKKTQRPNNKR
jgi:hypothetical protein